MNNDVVDPLTVRIRQWFEPYYEPPRKSGKPGRNPGNPSTSPASESATTPTADPELRVLDYRNPLDNAINFKTKPGPNRVWCYHDARHHHLFAHLLPQSGRKFRQRDNEKRRKLEPMLWPTDVGTFDRTHVLPIGYHGSERDRRLLVGWDSVANRGIFEKFESKHKQSKVPVYWLTAIERTATGATWLYRVYDVETLQVIDELTHEMRATFAWKG